MRQLDCWFKVWVMPREVMRHIKATNPNMGLLLLSFVYGFLQAVGLFQVLSFGAVYPLTQLLIGSLVLAIPVGYISINISAFFLFITGKILRGTGGFKEVRAAYAWSKVPEVINLILVVGMIVCWGRGLFLENFNETMSYCLGFLMGRILLAVQIALGIWGLVILFYALSEMQKFAVWLAIINVILMTVCYVLLFTLLDVLAQSLSSHPVAAMFLS